MPDSKSAPQPAPQVRKRKEKKAPRSWAPATIELPSDIDPQLIQDFIQSTFARIPEHPFEEEGSEDEGTETEGDNEASTKGSKGKANGGARSGSKEKSSKEKAEAADGRCCGIYGSVLGSVLRRNETPCR